MATRTRTIKRPTKVQNRPVKRRRTAISTRKSKQTGNFFNVLIPLAFILIILCGLGFLLFKGYQTVTASSFFDVKRVDVRGASRISRDDIEKIVRQRTERNGVWNAELEQIKADLEKLTLVRKAVVSRILPDGILVQLNERIPRAVVRLNGRDFWVDDEGVDLSTVSKNENRPPFVLRGWDEAKTEKAQKENQERVKIFLKAQDEWQSVGLSNRVISVNLNDLQDAQAAVEDSGETVLISLGKEDFGKRLQKALSVIQGNGQRIESIVSHGGNVVATQRKS